MTSARVFRISTRRNSRKRELTARVTTDFLNYVIIIKFGYFYLAYPNLTLTPIQMKRNDYGHSICTCLCARSVNNFLRNNERRLKTSGGYWGGRPWRRVLRSRPLNVAPLNSTFTTVFIILLTRLSVAINVHVCNTFLILSFLIISEFITQSNSHGRGKKYLPNIWRTCSECKKIKM